MILSLAVWIAAAAAASWLAPGPASARALGGLALAVFLSAGFGLAWGWWLRPHASWPVWAAATALGLVGQLALVPRFSTPYIPGSAGYVFAALLVLDPALATQLAYLAGRTALAGEVVVLADGDPWPVGRPFAPTGLACSPSEQTTQERRGKNNSRYERVFTPAKDGSGHTLAWVEGDCRGPIDVARPVAPWGWSPGPMIEPLTDLADAPSRLRGWLAVAAALALLLSALSAGERWSRSRRTG